MPEDIQVGISETVSVAEGVETVGGIKVANQPIFSIIWVSPRQEYLKLGDKGRRGLGMKERLG